SPPLQIAPPDPSPSTSQRHRIKRKIPLQPLPHLPPPSILLHHAPTVQELRFLRNPCKRQHHRLVTTLQRIELAVDNLVQHRQMVTPPPNLRHRVLVDEAGVRSGVHEVGGVESVVEFLVAET